MKDKSNLVDENDYVKHQKNVLACVKYQIVQVVFLFFIFYFLCYITTRVWTLY